MPTFDFRTEAAKLTQGELVKGVVDMFIHERFATLVGKIPFMSSNRNEKEWVLEAQLASNQTAFNSYSNNVASSDAIKQRYSLKHGHLAINADTPLKDVAANSADNDVRTVYRIDASKRLAYDWEHQLANGMNLGPNLPGIEYYMAMYSGFSPVTAGGSAVLLDSLEAGYSIFPHRKMYLSSDDTDTYESTGDFSGGATKGPLTLEAVRDLCSRATGMGFDALVTTRIADLWLRHLYQVESGGSTPDVYADEDFGMSVWRFEGVPIIRLDHTLEGVDNLGVGASVGGTSPFGATVSDAAGTQELVVGSPGADADADFIGFSDRMVGLTLTLDPNGTPDPVTIVSVKDRRTVDVTSPSSAHTDADFVVERQDDLIYGLKFSQYDGLCCSFNTLEGIQDRISDVDDDLSGMLGFIARSDGETDDGRKFRDKFDWFGMPVVMKPYGIARLSGFTAPATY